MFPLIFVQLSSNKVGDADLRDFWRLLFHSLVYLIRLVNTHVILGALSLFMMVGVVLRLVMTIFLQDSRNISELFESTMIDYTTFFWASGILLFIMTVNFQ